MTHATADERSIFLEAIEIASAEGRAAYLDSACADDPALRARVEALLLAHARPLGLLDAPDAAGQAVDPHAAREGPGTVIGPYKLLEQIGEGGFGVVFMAEQARPVRRTVALKVIKAGMDSRQVLARFEAERQALALMDHPNIAKVLDAGTTAANRPYFVMELVKGVAITRYCDERRLTPRERLELFLPVCRAVQHAHQKGVIHRDLKPSNVLVGLYDGVPVPKVIDFGVAKATEQKLTEATLFTGFGAVVGTPEYMSPEQAQLDNLDVDTRSDVYSLGVLLYELLTGTTPLDRTRLKQAALLEVLRVIREEEPPKPSTRLGTSAELPAIAAFRGVEPRNLRRLVHGELDWIVMKALEKDRARRYETAAALAADLRRHLDDEPVQAGPPSAWYRFGKFAHRNRVGMSMAGIVALALITMTPVSLWLAARATDARSLAQERLGAERAALAEARDQRGRAERNLAEAARVVDRMLTRVADEKLANVPQMEGLRKVLLEDAVQFYEEFLRQNQGNRSLQYETAKAHLRLSRLLHNLGDYRAVGDLSRQAIASLEGLLAENPTRVDVRVELAEALSWRGMSFIFRDDYSERANRECEECLRRSAAIFEQLSAQFPDNADYRLRHIIVLSRLALRLNGSAKAGGVVLARQIVLLAERLAADYPDRWEYRSQLGESYGYLGWYLWGSGKAEEGLGEFRKSFEILDSLPEGLVASRTRRVRSLDQVDGLERSAAWLKIAAARVLIDLGRHEEAEPLLRASMALYVAEVADFPTFGANHHHLANAKLELGRLLAETARVEEGIRLCRESLDAHDRAIELEHSRPNTWDRLLENCRAVGMILERAGSPASAEEVYRRGVRYADRFEREARDRGDSGWFDQILEWRCRNRWRLADLLRRKGATAEADELVQQVDTLVRDHLALRKAKLGPDHPDAMRSLNNLASSYSARGRHADALRLREEVLRVYRDAPQRHADKRPEAKVLNNLAWLLATCPDPELRDPGRAVGLAKEAVELAPTAPEYHNTLGVARYRAGDWRGAIEALTKSEELAPDRNLGTNALFLAMAHRQLGDEPRALRWFDEADRWMQKTARTDAELIRFRAEAEQLLRVEGRAQTGTKDGPR